MKQPNYVEVGRCPSCGKKSEYDSVGKDNGDIIQYFMECERCETEWTETHTVPPTKPWAIEYKENTYELPTELSPEAAYQGVIKHLTECLAIHAVGDNHDDADLMEAVRYGYGCLGIDNPYELGNCE